jgi:hypothetical protein
VGVERERQRNDETSLVADWYYGFTKSFAYVMPVLYAANSLFYLRDFILVQNEGSHKAAFVSTMNCVLHQYILYTCFATVNYRRSQYFLVLWSWLT